jgi:queuine tRNA-ribosyltransferase
LARRSLTGMKVTVLAQSRVSRARVCRVDLPSGRHILTPSFVAVGSNTLLKTVPPGLCNHAGPVFFNTFHMSVQPGVDTVASLGGLHAMFNCRERVLFTDSGGFQAFSLSRRSATGERSEQPKELKGACKRRFDDEPPLLLKVTDDGIKFRSYRDGSVVMLTPESSVAAQQTFGSDVALPLDELLPQHADERRLRRAFDRTHEWQRRSLEQHRRGSGHQAMLGIVHGGSDLELRRESIKRLLAMQGFDGLAVGGSLGETTEEMESLLQRVELPPELFRHLLGVASPITMRGVIALGFDSFDSVFATRSARHGSAFVLNADGRSVTTAKISSARFKNEAGGLGPVACECFCCSSHSAGLLHHLSKCHDSAVGTLLTIHNVHVMNQLVAKARQDIFDGVL